MATTSYSGRPVNERSRSWIVVINNYTEEERQTMLGYDCAQFVIVGKEVGENGTPHLQGYIRCNNAVRLSTLKKVFPRAHLEIAKGTPEQNITYCSKDGDFEERGDRPETNKQAKGWLHSLEIMNELAEENYKDFAKSPAMTELLSMLYDLACEIEEFSSELNGETVLSDDEDYEIPDISPCEMPILKRTKY